ncbi:hypothetical protein HZS_3023 [Henneguya salminicola]|nr:hypothetical protein HZS_3023 [Henneguya salminicola]
MAKTLTSVTYSEFPFFRLIENFGAICLQEINKNAWTLQALKIFGLYLSLLNIMDDDSFSEFLSLDYEKKFQSSLSILTIIDNFIRNFLNSKIGSYLIECCSEIAYKCNRKMYDFINTTQMCESYYLFLEKIFLTSLSIIKALTDNENNLTFKKISRIYSHVKNSINDHLRILYDVYQLNSKCKFFVYEEIPTFLSFILSQEITQNNLNILYTLLIDSCTEISDAKKIIASIYSFIQINIDQMGTSTIKYKILFTQIFEKYQSNESNPTMKFFLSNFKDLEKMIDILCKCSLENMESSECLIFKLIRYQNIIELSQELNQEDFTLSLIYRIKELNEQIGSYSEAAKIIRILISSTEQSQITLNMSKSVYAEEDCLNSALKLDEKARNFYFALKNCKLLIEHYESNGYPCDKISDTYQKMANFSKELDRFSISSYLFYFVKFYGKKIPSFIKDYKYIFYLGNDVKLGDAIDFFKKNINFIKILNPIQKKQMLSEDENYISIRNVIPKKSKSMSLYSIQNKNKVPYESLNKIFKNTKVKVLNKDGSVNNIMSRTTYEVYGYLPSHVPFSRIINKKTKILSEIDQSISNIKLSIEDMNSTLKSCIKDPGCYNSLIMKLQGNLIAKVNGGIEIFIDKYFGEKSFRENIEEGNKILKLKILIKEFMDANFEAITITSISITPDLTPLLQEINLNYNITRENLHKYNINCRKLLPEGISNRSPDSSMHKNSIFTQKQSTYFWNKINSSRQSSKKFIAKVAEDFVI